MDENWFETHCYGCGAAWSPEVLALMARMEAGEDVDDALNEASREHEACFE